MKIITLKDIRKFKPCYDPSRHWPEDWQGTALDILKTERCPPEDLIWVVTRKGFLSDKVLRLSAVDSARRALSRVENPDQRSIEMCNVAEKFAHGKATKEELRVARISAAEAYAAYAAYEAYAYDAAYDAAADAAASAAYDAAVYAAYAYAYAYATSEAYAYAARKEEREKQVQTFVELIEKYEEK